MEIAENILSGDLIHAEKSLLPKSRSILSGKGVQLNVPTESRSLVATEEAETRPPSIEN
jgi:hypothetical protein